MYSKSKHFYNSFVFMIVSAVLLIVAFLGYSYAWFTDSKSVKLTGNVPVVAVNVQYAGLTQGTNCYTFSQHDADDVISTLPSLSFQSTSNIGVYVRARITFNWSSLDQSLGSVYDFVNIDIANNWYGLSANSNSSTNDNTLVQSGWLYYRDTNAVVSNNTAREILHNIAVNEDMPDSIKIQIFVEAVQANQLGASKFGNNLPTGWLS